MTSMPQSAQKETLDYLWGFEASLTGHSVKTARNRDIKRARRDKAQKK